MYLCLTYLLVNKSCLFACKEKNYVSCEQLLCLCLKINDYVTKIFVIIVEEPSYSLNKNYIVMKTICCSFYF